MCLRHDVTMRDYALQRCTVKSFAGVKCASVNYADVGRVFFFFLVNSLRSNDFKKGNLIYNINIFCLE